MGRVMSMILDVGTRLFHGLLLAAANPAVGLMAIATLMAVLAVFALVSEWIVAQWNRLRRER